jgi:hypothetical protein
MSSEEDGAPVSVISFPEVVDERAARTVATGVVVLALTTIATRSPVLAAVLALGFLARVLSGPRFSPLALVATRVVVPRLAGDARPVLGEPKRFAQGIGLAFSTTALVLLLVGERSAAVVVLAMLVVAAGLEAGLGLCLGCKIYGRLFPDRCERCIP